MSKLKGKVVKKVMAVILSGALMMSNMTIYATEAETGTVAGAEIQAVEPQGGTETAEEEGQPKSTETPEGGNENQNSESGGGLKAETKL